MSVITNKDRINENNDRINRLIELVKQKALTSNPKYATTEEEMDAMLTDKNIGKVVKYIGAPIGTPPAVGDVVDKLYFNTDITPNFEAIKNDSTVIKGADIHQDFASSYFALVMEVGDSVAYLGFTDMSEMQEGLWALMLFGSDGIIYLSQDVPAEITGGDPFPAGWQMDSINVQEAFGGEVSVTQIGGQNLWSSYISKEPFTGGKYEKNALYIVAEGESEVIENPTAVGDEVTQIYFDTTKSTEEVLDMLKSLDWDNPDYYDEGEGKKYITLFGKAKTEFVDGVSSNESSSTGIYLCVDAEKMEFDENGTLVAMHYITAPFGDDVLFFHANVGEPNEWELDHYGWQTTSPLTSVNPFTIGYVRDKDIWGGFLSASDQFASAGSPAAPRARRLNITEGSLAINENGKFDVSNMESVEVNVAGGGLLTAATEEEMEALLVEDNLGKVVKYVGEAGELIGVPPSVGDTTPMTLYFNTNVTPNFDAIKNDSAVIKGADIHEDWANAYFVLAFGAESGEGGGYLGFFDMSELQEGLFVIADDQSDHMIYISQDISAEITGGEAISAGWQLESIDVVDLISHGSSVTSYTVQQIGGQDLWSSYISKEPFATGGEYETDGLYAIAEDTPGTPVAVGDTISALYFDVSKEPDFSAFDFNEDNYYGVRIDFDGGSYYTLGLAKITADESPTGQDEYQMYLGEGEVVVYSSCDFEEDGIVYAIKGWQQPIIDTNGRVDFPEAGVVNKIEQQAGGWDTFVSKEPFATGDVIKFEHHIVPNGVMPINDNGIFDIAKMASVEVNVASTNKLPMIVNGQTTGDAIDITASDLDGVTEIRRYAFYESQGIKSVTLPSTCTSICSNAFGGCSVLTSVDMPNVTSIESGAFSLCTALTSVNMPNVVSIEDHAFVSCSALNALTIPSSCTSIGDNALVCGWNCVYTFEGTTPPTIMAGTFSRTFNIRIIVPAGCGDAYKTAAVWSEFVADKIVEATE